MKSKKSSFSIPAMRQRIPGTTYRLSAEIAYELELHVAARRMRINGPITKCGIVEAALAEWFSKYPLGKDQRAAAELLMTPERGER